MTQKNLNNLNEFKKKITWFILPLLITFFVWITMMIYQINTSVQVVQSKVEERAKSEQVIWGMVRDNNEILRSDKELNTYEHKQLFSKLKDIEVKVDRLNRNHNYTISIDTTYILPYKSDSFIWVKNNDLTDANKQTK